MTSASGELRRGSGRPTTSGHRTAHGEEGHSSTRVNIGLSTLESCEDVKRLSYEVVEEQRVLNLRPSCLESNTAGMGRRSERMAHAVQGVPTVRRQNKWDKRGAFKACNLDANRLRQFSDLPTSVRLDSFASPPVSSPVWRLAVRGTYPPA